MWKSNRQYYDVIRIRKSRGRGRDLGWWVKLVMYVGVLVVMIYYIVRIFLVDAATTGAAVWLPLIAR